MLSFVSLFDRADKVFVILNFGGRVLELRVLLDSLTASILIIIFLQLQISLDHRVLFHSFQRFAIAALILL